MIVKGGSTDVTTYFALRLSATGADATGLTISDFDMQYTRTREVPTAKVDAVALAATNTAHTDNRGIEIDATDQPGLYRFDWPDAAFAAGTDVILSIKHTSCFTEHLRVDLVDYNPRDGVRLGLTALPNAAADAAGGLIISDAGGLDADAQRSDVAAILVDTGTTLDGRLPAALVGGRIDASVGAMASGVVTATAIAADAIGASELAADAAAEIAAAVWDLDATAHQTQGTFGQAIGDPAADTNTIFKAVVTDAAGATVGVDVVAIQADTDDIQTRLPAALTGDGNIKADALKVGGSDPSTAADFNAEVVDALAIDTYAEPGQGAPAATTSLAAKINYLYKAWRNKKTQSASEFDLYADDAATVDQKSTVSDSGTVVTRSEMASGP